MAYQDNNPTRTYVSVKNLVITYNNTNYAVDDMYSQDKYFYWSVDNPSKIETYNTRFDKNVTGKYLLLINDEGIHKQFLNEDIKITFADLGFGNNGIDKEDPVIKDIYDKINNWNGTLPDQIGDLEDRFNTSLDDAVKVMEGKILAMGSDMETKLTNFKNETGNEIQAIQADFRTEIQSVTGDISTLGQIVKDEQGNTLQEKVNNYIKTVDTMRSDIYDTQYKYNLDAEKEELRANLVNSLISVFKGVNDLKSDLDDLPLEETIISSDKSNILSYFTTIQTDLTVANSYIDALKTMTHSEGNATMVTKLNTCKTNLTTAYNDLQTMVTSCLSDNQLSTADVTNITNKMYNLIEKINTAQATCDEAIKLGVGVSIFKQASSIFQSQDKVKLGVMSIDKAIDNLHEEIKNASLEITDEQIKSAVGDTVEDMVTASVDNLKIGGTNLIDGSLLMVIPKSEVAESGAYVYRTLANLQANTNYVFTIDTSQATEGSFSEYSVKLYDLTNNVQVDNKIFKVGNTAQVWKFTPSKTCQLIVYAGLAGDTSGKVLTLNKVKLERGSTSTDWSPSPSDIETMVNGVEGMFTTEADVNIYDDDGNIIGTTKQFVNIVDRLNEAYQTASNSLNRISETEKLFEENGEYYLFKKKFTEYEQTLDGFNWTIGANVEENGQKIDEILTNIQFTNTGIIIGKSNSQVKLVLENDILSFQDAYGSKLAYFSDDKLVINDAKILGDLNLGDFGILTSGGLTITRL